LSFSNKYLRPIPTISYDRGLNSPLYLSSENSRRWVAFLLCGFILLFVFFCCFFYFSLGVGFLFLFGLIFSGSLVGFLVFLLCLVFFFLNMSFLGPLTAYKSFRLLFCV